MMASASVVIQRLPHAGDLPLPSYATALSAGLDLAAAVPDDKPVSIPPGQRRLLPTGFAFALPKGYEGQLRPRSGRALREGITLLNSPGTLDADYRGELKILLINHGAETVVISRGERIAQLVIAPVCRARISERDRLPETGRGAGGFGSTGR
ncbi:MAG: dUTP diphosphatase [Cyclonatronaceae bacterium]